ncbi:hypothetical protein GLYMA_08G350100v4 [Glycine max]|uniref:FBD domain-containing protein n=1 Tax=Glycine max TaxID=3847 RepID=A0A0R0IWU8_SOYBN|nr:uncharacterized protein LOC100820083 isoform X1 [Glycine max]KAH1054569.1 hypothetical protein GYH30_023387 [Glycine max]KRH46673.1 hypothetical protein GLYMA_08G350100v4 [Glycine max]|eukprot:XP_025985604.1 uncharacterized protein LOC100820083 isoform X1 [Glycine max]
MLLEFVWLPNLRTLWLASFRLVDENSIPRILQVFSSLEHLVLILQSLNENENESQSEGVQVESLCFSIPSLKWFELCSDEQEFNVVVKAENLVNFVCDLEGLHKVTLDALNLKSLTVATCEITQFVREHYEGSLCFFNDNTNFQELGQARAYP